MNSNTLRNLGIVLFVLVAVLVGLELADDTGTSATGDLLFEDLRERINDVDSVTVERSGAETVVIERQDAGWVVTSRGGYPAEIARVREVLLALADAVVLEEKTANPDLYASLGVRDPDVEDSAGVRLTATTAADSVYAVVIGNAAQGSNRYARIVGEAKSVLIDKNLGLPDDAGGWLDTALIDIPSRDVQSVRIEHADGETILVTKPGREATDFSVADIPAGRELSYPTVANAIGGALASLALEDVRNAIGGSAETVTTVTTFDGLVAVVSVYPGEDDAKWIAIEASAAAADESDSGADSEAGMEAGAEPAVTPVDPAAVAGEINTRVSGWEYRLPSYKTNQVVRRWDDILAAETDESE